MVDSILLDESEQYIYAHFLSSNSSTPSVTRGQIQNKETNKIVASTFRIQHEMPATDLPMEDPRVTYTIGWEACALYIWPEHDKRRVRVSTNKKIDANKSHWGPLNPSFESLYLALGGSMDYEHLFGKPERESVCYMFLVVHYVVQSVSQIDIGDGKLIFVGMIDLADSPQVLRMAPDIAQIHLLAYIDVVHVLKAGHFVMATQWAGVPYQSEVQSIIPYYSRRYEIGRSLPYNNDPDLWHKVIMMSQEGARDKTIYSTIYPWIDNAMPEDMTGVCVHPRKMWIRPCTLETATVADMQRNVWNVLLYYSSPSIRSSLSYFINLFYINRSKLSRLICSRKHIEALICDRIIKESLIKVYNQMRTHNYHLTKKYISRIKPQMMYLLLSVIE